MKARVAFHLRRHGIYTTALTATGVVADSQHAADIVHARASLGPADAALLETVLGLSKGSLTRELTGPENEEWSFYRTSARNRHEVWSRAKDIWTSRGVSMRQASAIMRYSPDTVKHIMSNQSSIVLTHPRAVLLTERLNVPQGPSILIAGLEPDIVPERA